MSNLTKFFRYAGALLIFIILFSITKIVSLYTDFLWFDALGFSDIFMTSLWAKITLFLLTTTFFFFFVTINLKIAQRLLPGKFSIKNTSIGVTLIALMIGLFSSSAWMTYLQFVNQVSFNLTDPILFKDVSFYVFSLPFYLFLLTFLFTTLVITLFILSIFYLKDLIKKFFNAQPLPNNIDLETNISFDYKKELANFPRKPMAHLAVLGAFVFFLLAAKQYLARFSVMYSESGIVVGAGYVDVHVFLPVVKLMMVLAIIVGLFFFGWMYIRGFKKRHILLGGLIIYFVMGFIGLSLAPALVQSFIVSPNELNLEKEYIANNIKFTRLAYGLDDVEEKDFALEQSITPKVLENAKETIDNVRILDYRPLIKTYKQTQEIRLYYDLSGIDIDRYQIDGKYTQVMLAPRELNQRQVAANAQTWVNLHMVYTHGFGVVMSPVNSVTDQGLPNYLIKDIPPTNSVKEENLMIEEPRIYYGEIDNDFVLVNTNTEEFDFPKGNSNEYIQYDGKGGIDLSSFFRKLLMAIKFSDIKILLSSDVTTDSKIQFNRNIQDRIQTITPFLLLDQDPYLVIDDGKLFWIQDAYTVTGNYPYSQKFKEINYIRNAVKVVVDAYNGDVTYYVIENNPLMQVYQNIFPNQFKSFDEFTLNDHLRYPEDLFTIQAQLYANYHMDDVTVFYNKEDAWEIPTEIYGTGQQIRVEPYYIIMKLPGETKEEFVLMTTFTPIKKDNMNSWLAARSDDDHYGKLLLYKFPKDKLIFGPLQIEARIDQDSDISSQITLWSQQGSRVTRGNLLVIPIENNLLYIEPLYLQAETGQLPELKRVIVSDGDRVVMEKSLGEALAKLFGSAVPKKTSSVVLDTTQTSSASDIYNRILDAMNKGDWETFGKEFSELGRVLG